MEGDKETEIHGGHNKPILIQTVTGEKETAIMGSFRKVELLHGNQIDLFLSRYNNWNYNCANILKNDCSI